MEPSQPRSASSVRADRAALLTGLFGLMAMSWAYLIYQDWAMRHMDIVEMAMPGMEAWTASDLLHVFVMWAIMMVAMMLPAATPMVMLFATVNQKRRAPQQSGMQTWLFVAGYLTVWTGFSVLATLGQWGLQAASLLSPMMRTSTPVLGGLILILAGIYQWTSLKQICLVHCRSPLGFVMNHWRDGHGGAFVMGARHGLYCLGCCWLLMALLFVTGVMNLLWIAVLSVFVLAEKTLPGGQWMARGAGLLFLAWGSWLLFTHVPL